MNKAKLIVAGFAILLIVATAVILVFQKNGNQNNQDSHEYHGTLLSVNGEVLNVEGEYIYDDESTPNTQRLSKVEIVIDSDTKITREELVLPSKEELAKTGGRFDPEKLQKKTSLADLSTLQKDTSGWGISVFAKSDKEIFGSTKFEAKEITYRVVDAPQ